MGDLLHQEGPSSAMGRSEVDIVQDEGDSLYLHSLIKSFPDGAILIVDRSFCYRLAAGPLLQKLEHTPEEMVGKTIWDVLPAEEAETQAAHYQEALSGTPSSIELRRESCDYLSRAVPLHDANEEIFAIAVFAHDITKRRQLEEALRESEARARSRLTELEVVYDQAPVGLCVYDTGLRYRRVNRRLAEYNGLPAEEHIGRSIHDVFPEGADQLEPLMRQVLRTGKPLLNVQITTEIPDSPGQTRTWIEHFLPLKNCDDEVTGLNAVVEEITERLQAERALRESEERFRLALQNVPLIICQCDLDLRYTWMAQAQGDWSTEQVVGRRDDELLPADLAEPILAFKRRVLRSGIQGRTEITIPLQHKTFTWDVTAEPLRDPDGNVAGLTLIALEISERKEAEAEREQLLQELAEERRRLETLTTTLEERVRKRKKQVRALASELMLAEQRERQRIAQMLHDDIQQMLYSVQLNLHLIGKGLEPEIREELIEIATYVDQIIEGTRSLTTALSSPAQRRRKLKDIFGALAGGVKEHYGLHVDVQVEASMQLPSEEIRELVTQLTRELLFNVVKHAGVPRAQLLARVEEKTLIITVRDEGAGFDANGSWEPQDHEGSFGLYSVQQRVNLYGGKLEIHSERNGGTEVSIFLPLESD